ncbi:MAG TPA: hypothetical protein VFL76_08765 [Edaphocola sp.]|nr:hypothetical protein [Edaphocola sp.]
MIRNLLLLSICTLSTFMAKGQNTYRSASDEVNHLLDRMETKSGEFSNDLFLSNKGVSRKDVYDFLVRFRGSGYYANETTVDDYNIFKALSENGEWAMPNGDGAEISKYALGPFYQRQPDFIHLNKHNFFWVLNPVLGAGVTAQQKPAREVLWQATEGLETRGRLGRWLGFSMALTNNNTRPAAYIQRRIDQWQAIPGAGSYRQTANGYQYWQFEGNLDASLIKDHISLDIGYGKHFIGDGIRSLFLSDYAGNAFYAGINTKIWKLNYQNLYLRLNGQDFTGDAPTHGYKYATIHYLSANIRPWLNIGLFESVTFSRNGGYEIAYMNPVIFYRAVERALGSPDKVAIGLNAKAIVAKRLNFYGQFLINEFNTKEFFSRNGYWSNKWGLQAGLNYFDAFTVPNLDIQAEVNMVRPYTYAHYDNHFAVPVENFSTWNQPLAHPLGAGFQELIGNIRYQPLPRLTINAGAMAYRQGVDTGSANFGNDIFRDYKTRNSDFGVKMINGPEARCLMLRLDADYELKTNLYVFIGGAYREYTVRDNVLPGENDLFFTAGFRLNLSRSVQNWY